REKHIKKILDLMPSDINSLKTIFTAEAVNLKQEELKQIVDKTYPYSKVLFYHSKFVTVLKQENEISDISGANVEQQAGSGEFDYILEPDIDKMLYFFENQILTLLFKAIFLESRLSRTSARMVSMYSAENNADNVLRHQRLQLSKTLRSIQNKAILESFSANLSINKSSTNEGEMYENIIKGLNVFGR
ncbi:MAG: ATP synthase gamma chain, partial [Candidatus Daviesbacteria bacterium GW2011_GWA1_38_7]